ncbi:MAG TPA: hypothetical protein VN238_20230 [Solirubrobacteraceae bacterium]|nr:hypothetical protein [Solirubrobacteraceae bacterium]
MSPSRYATSAKLERCGPDGQTVRYLAPRILPQPATVAGGTSTQVRADEVDRLDLVAARTLRDAQQAWRIADANTAMDPLALTRRSGATLQLPGSPL